ncbi:piRNA biogenesis protein EXD1-like [Bolinopsis microptera]|uniref:piRNA biogenesis protein EXD1-like n=1 Tax=Bolinopsis microptera TaxID=2820187 RepID=UPI00307A38C8
MASSSRSTLYENLKLVDTVAKVKTTVKELRRQKEISVDCEGNNLSREGTLDILIIGTVNRKVFLFDITKMGVSAFDAGLRDLLESGCDVMAKLMYDCRNDSDALMHLYDVKLAGVLDLQLVEIDSRRKSKQNHWFLKGLKKSIEVYDHDEKSERTKKNGTEQIEDAKRNGTTIWDKRPLSPDLKDYCAVDTVKLFSLLKVFRKKMEREKMLEASERYVDYFRSYETFPETKFYRHGFLPDEILRSNPRDPKVQYNDCQGCKKKFKRARLDLVNAGEKKRANFCSCCSRIITRIENQPIPSQSFA